jgi:hypothetical protein
MFRRLCRRHVWLAVGVVGTSACTWWLSSVDNFAPKEHLALMLACWGAFLGLFPPAFLTDEIEGLNPRDFLYAGALAVWPSHHVRLLPHSDGAIHRCRIVLVPR